jgi:hypothetical protein
MTTCMSATSLVEEEHVTWYFTSTTLVALRVIELAAVSESAWRRVASDGVLVRARVLDRRRGDRACASVAVCLATAARVESVRRGVVLKRRRDRAQTRRRRMAHCARLDARSRGARRSCAVRAKREGDCVELQRWR